MLGKKRIAVVVTVCVNLFIFTVNSMVTPEVCLMMFVSKTIVIMFSFPFSYSHFFFQKKDIWSQLVENDCNVCFNALSHLFVLLLDFLFFTCPSFLSFFLFLHRWIIMMHIRTGKLFFFAGIKVSLIVHHQCACVFTAKAVTMNYLVCVHTINVCARN